MARLCLWTVTWLLAVGCNNDYGQFRFPRHAEIDSGADSATDAGVADAAESD
jgi:hypothetical protein